MALVEPDRFGLSYPGLQNQPTNAESPRLFFQPDQQRTGHTATPRVGSDVHSLHFGCDVFVECFAEIVGIESSHCRAPQRRSVVIAGHEKDVGFREIEEVVFGWIQTVEERVQFIDQRLRFVGVEIFDPNSEHSFVRLFPTSYFLVRGLAEQARSG